MDYQLGPGPLQVDQNTIDEKIKGDIGIVENGDVATHTIPNGYYVIWKGDLYVAKTNISSGTTLSAESNGNLTAKPNGLGGEVAALNSNITNVQTTGCKMQSVQIAPSSSYTFQGMANSTLILGLYDSERYHYATILPSNFTGNWSVDMYGTFNINIQYSGNDLIVTSSGGVYITVLAIHSGI